MTSIREHHDDDLSAGVSDDLTVESSESAVGEPGGEDTHSVQSRDMQQRGPRPTRRSPIRVRVGDIRRRLNVERREALDTRDPVAIRKTGERFEALAESLAEYPDDARIDPWAVAVGVSQAAKALGFNAREVRSLIRLGRLPARKIKNEWKIPLDSVL